MTYDGCRPVSVSDSAPDPEVTGSAVGAITGGGSQATSTKYLKKVRDNIVDNLNPTDPILDD